MLQGVPTPVEFQVTEEGKPSTIVVTGADGARFEIRLAISVQAVLETGQVNPLDGLPVYQLATQSFVQVTRKD